MQRPRPIERTGSSAEARAARLKQEFRRLATEIAEKETCSPDTFEEAARTLSDLKELRLARERGGDPDCLPVDFRCPISSQLMTDPVIVASGQTYERRFIQKWLDEGNRTCPQTKQVLSHLILTPNLLVRDMIHKWMDKHGLETPGQDQDNCDTEVCEEDRAQLESLLKKITVSSMDDQKQAGKQFRRLTKRLRSFRALIGETPDAVSKLVSLLSRSDIDSEPELQEDIVTTMLNLSIHENNKKIVTETPNAIPVLINALTKGRMETRSNAAAALFSLSALDDNKTLIAELGAMKPLVQLVDEGNAVAKKDAAAAIFNLCLVNENRVRAVEGGVVKVMLKVIKEELLADELLVILAMLSSNQEAVEEMARCQAVPLLLSIIRESTNGRKRENCAAILHSICLNDRTKLREVKEEENANGTLYKLTQNGTPRAQRKAASILERVRRITYTA